MKACCPYLLIPNSYASVRSIVRTRMRFVPLIWHLTKRTKIIPLRPWFCASYLLRWMTTLIYVFGYLPRVRFGRLSPSRHGYETAVSRYPSHCVSLHLFTIMNASRVDRDRVRDGPMTYHGVYMNHLCRNGWYDNRDLYVSMSWCSGMCFPHDTMCSPSIPRECVCAAPIVWYARIWEPASRPQWIYSQCRASHCAWARGVDSTSGYPGNIPWRCAGWSTRGICFCAYLPSFRRWQARSRPCNSWKHIESYRGACCAAISPADSHVWVSSRAHGLGSASHIPHLAGCSRGMCTIRRHWRADLRSMGSS